VKHLDLFSGIGGFALAARWVGWETVGFCEIDPYCQRVLIKNFPDVAIYDDIRSLELDGIEEGIDVVTAGYPCQPFSLVGERRGESDDRHLWPECRRIISRCRPRFFIGENVVGHISLGIDQVLFDLEDLGYSVDVFVLPACAVNAVHRRDRVYLVAYTDSAGLQGFQDPRVLREGWKEWPEHTARLLKSERRLAVPAGSRGGVHDGIPNRVDRLKSLGNAIVPQVAEVIFRAINTAQGEQRETYGI
jgi:DNA (cytosine-5)-methyltransferase 1